MNERHKKASPPADVINSVRAAQKIYATYTQEQVDAIFASVAKCANNARIPLAQMAVEETGMGVVEDKVIKNHYAAEYIYNAYKGTKTCGIIEEDSVTGIRKVAEPMGVIAAVIPTTNPTSTIIYKILLALKTRNGIIICPHPRAKGCSVTTAKLLLKAAVKAGAPAGIIGWIEQPSPEASDEVMRESDIILATGGPGMVKAAYSSGKPALGVGAGNTPAVIDSSADITTAVSSIIHSKTFDNGMICASEQSVIVMDDIYDAVCRAFTESGCYILRDEEANLLRKTMIINSSLNAQIVGRTAVEIAALAGITVPEDTKVLIGEVTRVDTGEAFTYEKLSPVLAMYRAKTTEEAFDIAACMVESGGYGHTASIYLDPERGEAKLRAFSLRMKACRILVNTPSSHGGIGDIYNFALPPSLTLGCGSWGSNSVSENVGVKHLLNIKFVAERRENMLWLRTPPKIYFKRGCLSTALEELKRIDGKQRVFVVTDEYLYQNGYIKPLTDVLRRLDMIYTVFFEVSPDPTLACVRVGAAQMHAFRPDAVIAIGGGSAIDAAKVMWMMYEHPDISFEDMALRFMDIRKRVYTYPKMGEKTSFIAIPTSAGTGSEVTPFAVITDEETGGKYPLADYEMLPHMAIIDVDLYMSAPPSLTAASGIDTVVHAIEAYVSMMASDYTDALAIQALKLCFQYLPRAYENGGDRTAREKMANAATLAGMAFANAFLGVCHSMAHKLGAHFHLPHGIANALLICEVIRFNASSTPLKMGTFPQYDHPMAGEKYSELARALGLPDATPEGLISAIDALKHALGIHPAISGYIPDEKAFRKCLDRMAEEAFDDQCTGANPRYPTIAEIKEIYLRAYSGS